MRSFLILKVLLMIHIVIACVHGIAHLFLGIELHPADFIFAIPTSIFIPFIILPLDQSHLETSLKVVMFASIVGGVHGVLVHFLIESLDNLSQIDFVGYGTTFTITVNILLVSHVLNLVYSFTQILSDRVVW